MKMTFTELAVLHLERSLRWYRDWLGLQVELLDEPRQFVLLRAGENRLALNADGVSTANAHIRLHFQVLDLKAEVARLAKLGATMQGELKSSTEGYTRARYLDPDGYTIILHEWR